MTTDSLDVETTSGTFRGVRRGPAGASTCAWLGVPYAAPPIGPLRFRPPQPVVPRPGVRPADRYAAAASQAGSLTAPVRRLGDGVGEDCLHLNVHATRPPEPGAARPVLVWIHGGAFTGGSGALYDGGPLAALGDVVVVTVNYRLGIFGFVDLGAVTDLDVTSNNGLRDLIAALQWVRDNIAAFGGDPAQVTVAGESAGSVAISLLLCAPEAAGLFRGAVMQSGSYSLLHGDRVRERIAHRYLAELEIGRGDAHRLRDLSTGRLLAAQAAVAKAVTGTTPAAPWFDGDVVPGSLLAAQEATRPEVALLAGSNHDESEMFRLLPGDILPTDRATVAERLAAELGDAHAGAILRTYPAGRRGDRALTTDFDFAQPTRHFAERHAEAGGRTFVYRFDAAVPWWGATHAAELAYLWNWKGIPAWALRGPASAARLSLATRMQWAWLGFVRDLTPGPSWPEYTADERALRVFDPAGDRVESDPHPDRRLAWAGADVMPKE